MTSIVLLEPSLVRGVKAVPHADFGFVMTTSSGAISFLAEVWPLCGVAFPLFGVDFV
jgi:hypothetical protein